MNKFIQLLVRHWRKSPVKITLTVLSVALGTGILVVSFSAGAVVQDQLTKGVAKSGAILYVANATWNTDGSMERVMPGDWDASAPDKVAAESGAVKAAALVTNTPFDQLTVGTDTYRLRSSIGTTSGYFDVFSLKIVAGDAMLQGDVEQGSKKAWISEELANVLFGSAKDAIGKQIQPPANTFRRGPGEQARALATYYSIAGVFATPSEVARQSYGIADLVFPYTAMLPQGMNQTIARRLMSGTFVMRTSTASMDKAEAAVRAVLEADYPRSDGKPVSVAVWEGSARGASTYLKQLRQTISLFTVSVNILGLVLLVISSLGIFSVMVVELLGRRREIALERAIGASQSTVVREFWTWSMALSCIGAAAGILLALFLAAPIMRTIAPLVGEVSDQFRSAAGLTPASILGGLALALGCGGVLGALPAFAAVRGNIADTLREV
jgi:putative ABC transport system permease protein